MRIMIDARFYGLENSGLGRYTINLLDNLQKIDDKNSYQILLRDRYFYRLKFPKKWVKIRAEFPHYTIREQLFLPKVISRFKPDIFHSLNTNIPYFYKGNLITTVHDLTQIRFEKKATTHLFPVYLMKLTAYKLIFKKAVKYAVKIITPTNSVKDDLVDFYKINKDKIEVIYEGVQKLKNTSKSSQYVVNKYNLEGKRYFVYTGNAYPHKNLERAIEALMDYNGKYSEKIYFVIASSRSKFTEKLNRFIAKYKARDYVYLLGFVPDEFIEILYSNSVGFLYPSTTEGFGLPGLEALQAGTLLLASNISVFKEVYGKHATYFNPYDFTSITKAIEESININKSLREKKIKDAQEYIKKYSWEKMVRDTLKVYNQALT